MSDRNGLNGGNIRTLHHISALGNGGVVIRLRVSNMANQRLTNCDRDIPITLGRTDIHAYICGLDKMIKANRDLLKGLGCDRKSILYEKYD